MTLPGSFWIQPVMKHYLSFEHRMVDVVLEVGETSRNLISFREASLYAYEFANYIDEDDNF